MIILCVGLFYFNAASTNDLAVKTQGSSSAAFSHTQLSLRL